MHARDAAAAQAALLGLARTVGTMHAATRGRGAYVARRAALGPAAAARERQRDITPERWDELCASSAALGFPPPSAPPTTSPRWPPRSGGRGPCSR